MPIPASTELTEFLYICVAKKLLHPLMVPRAYARLPSTCRYALSSDWLERLIVIKNDTYYVVQWDVQTLLYLSVY